LQIPPKIALQKICGQERRQSAHRFHVSRQFITKRSNCHVVVFKHLYPIPLFDQRLLLVRHLYPIPPLHQRTFLRFNLPAKTLAFKTQTNPISARQYKQTVPDVRCPGIVTQCHPTQGQVWAGALADRANNHLVSACAPLWHQVFPLGPDGRFRLGSARYHSPWLVS
jgi:hypothetical protein